MDLLFQIALGEDFFSGQPESLLIRRNDRRDDRRDDPRDDPRDDCWDDRLNGNWDCRRAAGRGAMLRIRLTREKWPGEKKPAFGRVLRLRKAGSASEAWKGVSRS